MVEFAAAIISIYIIGKIIVKAYANYRLHKLMSGQITYRQYLGID